MNQTKMAVSTDTPNEMSRTPHQGILSNPSTEGPPGAMATIRQRQIEKGSFKKIRQLVLPLHDNTES